MFAEQTPINDPLILTSLETSTVAIMDIQGLATFDAVDALMNHRGGRNRGLGEESGVERSVDSGFATTNGNYSRLPFKVHAVSGLSELRIESEKDFNASHTYFPRGSLLMLLSPNHDKMRKALFTTSFGDSIFATNTGAHIVEAARSQKHTGSTIFLQNPFPGRSTDAGDEADGQHKDGTESNPLDVYLVHLSQGLRFQKLSDWLISMMSRKVKGGANKASGGSLTISHQASSAGKALDLQVVKGSKIDCPALTITPSGRIGVGIDTPSENAALSISGYVLSNEFIAHAPSIIEVNKTSGNKQPKVLEKLRKLRVVTGRLKGQGVDESERYIISRHELQTQFPELMIKHDGLDKALRGQQYGYQIGQLGAILAAAVAETADLAHSVNNTLSRHMRLASHWMKRSSFQSKKSFSTNEADSSPKLEEQERAQNANVKVKDLKSLEQRLSVLEKTTTVLSKKLDEVVSRAQTAMQNKLNIALKKMDDDVKKAIKAAGIARPHLPVS